MFAFIFLIPAISMSESVISTDTGRDHVVQSLRLSLPWEGAHFCHLWDKVPGGNLYPLSSVRQMQILCWLSCCASCQQGGLGMSLSVIVGLLVV